MKAKHYTIAAALAVLFNWFSPLAAADDTYSLARCRELALQNNVTVRNAVLEQEAAAQTKRAAFTRFFPTISASGTVMRSSEEMIDLGMFSLLDRMTLGSVTVTQPLFAGGRIVAGNRLAEVGRQAGERKRQLSENETLLRTEEQYWRIVSLDEKIKTLDIYGRMLDELARQADDAVRSGLITRNDLLKIRVKQSEWQLLRLQAVDGRHLALLAFCQFLGIECRDEMVLGESLPAAPPPASIRVDHPTVLPARPEAALLRLAVKAEKLQTALKRGEFLPQLGVGVSGYYLSTAPGRHQYNTLAFCSLSLPVSEWWRGVHEWKEKRLREEIARNNQRDGEELLLLEMQKTWYELSESYKEIELTEKLVEQAEENLRVSTDAYRQGLGLMSDLLEAQAGLQQARARRIDALAGNRIKLVHYLHATGRYEEARRL